MLIILPPDKLAILSAPVLGRDKVFVRRGIHADGSCFFHAYLRATRKREYSLASYEARLEMVREVREKLIEGVSRATIAAVGNGALYRILYAAAARALIEKSNVSEIVGAPLDAIAAFEQAFEHPDTFYLTFVNNLRAQSPSAGSKLIAWCYDLFLQAEIDVISTFKDMLSAEINSECIEYISRALQVNFCFLQCPGSIGGAQFYPKVCEIVDKKWSFIVMLWVNDNHYELVGEMDERKHVSCLFSSDSIIAARIIAAREE